jgi:hypothetical protein
MGIRSETDVQAMGRFQMMYDGPVRVKVAVAILTVWHGSGEWVACCCCSSCYCLSVCSWNRMLLLLRSYEYDIWYAVCGVMWCCLWWNAESSWLGSCGMRVRIRIRIREPPCREERCQAVIFIRVLYYRSTAAHSGSFCWPRFASSDPFLILEAIRGIRIKHRSIVGVD